MPKNKIEILAQKLLVDISKSHQERLQKSLIKKKKSSDGKR